MNRGTYKPRDYQLASIAGVRAACSKREKPILVLPTGGGKTKTAVYGIVKPAADKGNQTLWIAHRTELIQQAKGDIEESGVEVGVIQAGHKPNSGAMCQVASVQTLARRLKKLPPAKIVIIDECHHVRSATYMLVVEYYMAQGAVVIGLTATPERLDGQGLGQIFDTIVEEVTVRFLIEHGFLADYEYFAPATPDLSAVNKVAGDFNTQATAAVMDRPEMVGDIVEHYQRHLSGQRALCFATRITHSLSIVEDLQTAGVPAAHLDGTDSREEREDTIAAFAEGKILVLSNVNLFDEGFDIPACQGVIIARPTMSFVRHRQMIGRAMRPKENGSKATILDHAGNYQRHGMPDDPHEWDLDCVAAPVGESKHKSCPECFAVIPVGVRECPYCGFEFEVRERKKPEMAEGQLQRIKVAWTPERKRELYRSVMAQARVLGRKPGWASYVYKAKVGSWPTGFVAEIKRESFRLCEHKVWSIDAGCNHCGRQGMI